MEYQKAAEATNDLIGNKIANKIMWILKKLQHNNSETVTNEIDKEILKEIPKERQISSEEKQKVIGDLKST